MEECPCFVLFSFVCLGFYFLRIRKVIFPAQSRALCPWFWCQAHDRQAWTNLVKNAPNLTLLTPDSPLSCYHLCITDKIHYVLVVSGVCRKMTYYTCLFFFQVLGKQSNFIKILSSRLLNPIYFKALSYE